MGKWFEMVLECFATLSDFELNFENIPSHFRSTRESYSSKER
jgi:hypothetical protein